MTKYLVTFTGDSVGGNNPPTITAFGLTFALNEETPINVATESGEKIIAKLKGNHHFSVVLAGGEEGDVAGVATGSPTGTPLAGTDAPTDTPPDSQGVAGVATGRKRGRPSRAAETVKDDNSDA